MAIPSDVAPYTSPCLRHHHPLQVYHRTCQWQLCSSHCILPRIIRGWRRWRVSHSSHLGNRCLQTPLKARLLPIGEGHICWGDLGKVKQQSKNIRMSGENYMAEYLWIVENIRDKLFVQCLTSGHGGRYKSKKWRPSFNFPNVLIWSFSYSH